VCQHGGEVPFGQTTVVPCGTTTVVFDGGGGLLLLKLTQPPSARGTTRTAMQPSDCSPLFNIADWTLFI
jgi:hypothetical protein